MFITTGNIFQSYDVIDVVFGSEWVKGGSISKNSDETLENVKKILIDKGKKLGADAVINCTFDYKYGIEVLGIHTLEVFAYGTAIKIISSQEILSREKEKSEKDEMESRIDKIQESKKNYETVVRKNNICPKCGFDKLTSFDKACPKCKVTFRLT